ncbi:MAG: hypothetical protein ACJ8EA_05315 [Xanthobacteraceae bacterium]
MLREEAVSGGIQPDRSLPSVRPTRIITYAWGEKYIGELLSLTLPALLAPGNLPYVASTVPCEVVILTEEGAFPRLFGDPTVGKIQALCPVRLVGLDDLIPAPDKYGMALTYVLHRGFSDLGPSVTDTWLLFLNADFIIADGSLRNLIGQLAEGRRLVASPSYCVNAEAVVPELLSRVDPNTRSLTLSPREMAALVLRHRHNTIRGKTVNQPAMSVRYMDQFYWLVDHATLIGHQMPIAIVGMRPERHLAEPNSYWDHGLMTEFFPGTEPFVLGDSDDFLMLELRSAETAQDQLQIGWPDPREIARNTASFLTEYQREMARHPLTLHSADLPANIADARAALRSFVDTVLAHVPAVLPSHLDHPQWNYHRSGFIEARHKYLSARLGAATEANDPPASLSEVDKTWWKLDGVIKAHARRRADLVDLRDRQRSAVEAMLSAIEDARWGGIADELVRDLQRIETNAAVDENSLDVKRVVDWRREEGSSGPSIRRTGEAPPWAAPLKRSVEAWVSSAKDVREKKEVLARILEFIDRDHEDRLLLLDFEFAARRDPLQAEYDRMVKRSVASAVVPHVALHYGPRTSVTASGRSVLRFARDLYRRYYGVLPRVRPLHPYWAAMRHLVRIVDAAASEGAANVLVVVGATSVGETIADHLPGVHARVLLSEVVGGNLAKAFSGTAEFDLCICTLGPSELHQIMDVVKTVTPCMRKGGKIIAFHPNFAADEVPLAEVGALQTMFESPSSGRIHYAGSPQSARVAQRVRRLARTGERRLADLVRMAATLVFVTPSVFAANRAEAALTEEQWSRLPENCMSITVEIAV